MSRWPTTIPHDLARALAELDRQLNTTTDADRWGAIVEWLEAHGVEPPDHPLPTAPEVPGGC